MVILYKYRVATETTEWLARHSCWSEARGHWCMLLCLFACLLNFSFDCQLVHWLVTFWLDRARTCWFSYFLVRLLVCLLNCFSASTCLFASLLLWSLAALNWWLLTCLSATCSFASTCLFAYSLLLSLLACLLPACLIRLASCSLARLRKLGGKNPCTVPFFLEVAERMYFLQLVRSKP